jgi:hypothetical protein
MCQLEKIEKSGKVKGSVDLTNKVCSYMLLFNMIGIIN